MTDYPPNRTIPPRSDDTRVVTPRASSSGTWVVVGLLAALVIGMTIYAMNNADGPSTDIRVENAPAVTDTTTESAPATDAPATDVPAATAPAADAPATDVPATEAPATEAPATEAPVTDAPTTEAPATPPASGGTTTQP